MSGKEESFIDKIWNAFSSMKTGLILLGIVALVSGIGTLVPQEAFDEEKAQAVSQIWKTLGFTHLYSSVWFQLLMGLLCINLIVCSVQRFGGIYNQTFKPKVPANAGAVPQRIMAEVKGNISRTKLENILKGKGFRLISEEQGSSWKFVALKRRWGNWGSLITHIAFVVLVIGALIGSITGFKGYIMAGEGTVNNIRNIQLDKGTVSENFSVKINSFEDKVLANGEQDNWYTDLSILEGDKEVARKTISVNHPFSYKGVSFYQQSYNFGAKFTAEINGKKVPVQLQNRGADYYVAEGTDLFFIVAAMNNDQKNPILLYQVFQGQSSKPVQMGQLKVGQKENIQNKYSVTFDGLYGYTGLQVKKDPGVPIVWLGSAMLMLGLVLSFYWRAQTVSGVLDTNNEVKLTIGALAGKMAAKTKEDFDVLVEEIKAE